MSDLSDLKITDSDIAEHGVVAAPDKLTGTAAQNKALFDGLIRDAVKEKFNDMVDVLEDSLAWEPFDAEADYVPNNKVVYNGSSYLCLDACTGVLPTDTGYWRLIAAKGRDGTGAGDMTKDVYDPRGVEADIFAYAAERADTYTKEEVYTKAQSLSSTTAQKFVDAAQSLTAPSTPDDAFSLISDYMATLGVSPDNFEIYTGGGGGSTGTYSSGEITTEKTPILLFAASKNNGLYANGVYYGNGNPVPFRASVWNPSEKKFKVSYQYGSGDCIAWFVICV